MLASRAAPHAGQPFSGDRILDAREPPQGGAHRRRRCREAAKLLTADRRDAARGQCQDGVVVASDIQPIEVADITGKQQRGGLAAAIGKALDARGPAVEQHVDRLGRIAFAHQ